MTPMTKPGPRPYDLTVPSDRDRLLRDTVEHARFDLLLSDGADPTGRHHAHDALRLAVRLGFRLVPPGGGNG